MCHLDMGVGLYKANNGRIQIYWMILNRYSAKISQVEAHIPNMLGKYKYLVIKVIQPKKRSMTFLGEQHPF
jgi:hypothetical protein